MFSMLFGAGLASVSPDYCRLTTVTCWALNLEPCYLVPLLLFALFVRPCFCAPLSGQRVLFGADIEFDLLPRLIPPFIVTLSLRMFCCALRCCLLLCSAYLAWLSRLLVKRVPPCACFTCPLGGERRGESTAGLCYCVPALCSAELLSYCAI